MGKKFVAEVSSKLLTSMAKCQNFNVSIRRDHENLKI